MKTLKSASLESFDAFCVDVEVTFTKGMPAFSIVGLAGSAIMESRDRIKSCLLSNDYKFPASKITINLSPSDLKKTGSHFDLCIALLICLYDKRVSFEDFYIFSELGLGGELKDTQSIFSLVLSLYKQKRLKKVLVSKQSAQKLALIPNIDIYCVETFEEACSFFLDNKKEEKRFKNINFEYDFFTIHNKRYFFNPSYREDFKEVLGQTQALRAALISACGNHNMLLLGSAGCGKSMISKRLQYIMPPMSEDEILEKANLLAINNEDISFSPLRVMRAPHHSSTKASIFGGGTSHAKIGEIALCNNGILFFDELPHFPKMILEALREPLEDYKILISRVNSKVKYTTKFLFISAMNPCPCGNLLSLLKVCRCSDLEIKRYENKISQPLIDRIDLYVLMNEIGDKREQTYSSSFMHEEVLRVFKIQKNRGQEDLNGKLKDEDLKKYCFLDEKSQELLNKATKTYSLSFRSQNKVLKVARTIADLNKNEYISLNDLFEALSFRYKRI